MNQIIFQYKIQIMIYKYNYINSNMNCILNQNPKNKPMETYSKLYN